MAISVNRVYQKVLAIANKEQRGYITPQEFNLFSDHAQMEIFEQYFYDKEQFKRRNDEVDELTRVKIEKFKKETLLTDNLINRILPEDCYLVETVHTVKSNGERISVERLDRDSQYDIHASIDSLPLLKPNENRPVYWTRGNRRISITPNFSSASVNYIKIPITPSWTYRISAGSALYDPGQSGHQDFELHVSEENNLVLKILQLAGVNLKDSALVQAAAQSEASEIQQQKQ